MPGLASIPNAVLRSGDSRTQHNVRRRTAPRIECRRGHWLVVACPAHAGACVCFPCFVHPTVSITAASCPVPYVVVSTRGLQPSRGDLSPRTGNVANAFVISNPCAHSLNHVPQQATTRRLGSRHPTFPRARVLNVASRPGTGRAGRIGRSEHCAGLIPRSRLQNTARQDPLRCCGGRRSGA